MKQIHIFLLLLLCLPGASLAQTDSLQQQINQQVWKPFIRSFNNLDTEAFMAVHSKNMTRVIQDGGNIFGYDQYYQNTKAGNERNKKNTEQNNMRRTIELRFTQRIAAGDRAFEVGYYKTTSFQADGSTRSFYGKFHVLLVKEQDAWKILMDADAADNTDEAVFLTGKPIQ